MSSVAYQQCPCGSGKKVKFCCSKDIAAELEKVQESIDADQRMAALQTLRRLRKSKGDRAALLCLQAQVQMELRDFVGAKETIAVLREVAPENAIGLALDAQMTAAEKSVSEGCELLQQALGQCKDSIPVSIWQALGAITAYWSMVGNIAAARGHAWMRLSLSQSQDEEAGRDFIRLISNKEFPILLRQTDIFPNPAESAHWLPKLEEAESPMGVGHIAGTIANLETLDQQIPDQPAIVKRLAIYNDWLGRRDEGRKHRLRYAALSGISQPEAVEAEALALINSVEQHGVDQVRKTYAVEDLNAVLAKLQESKLANSVDTEQIKSEHGPVKAAFMLLDGESPEAIDENTPFDSIPQFLANVSLFGKTSDRPALVEFVAIDASEFAEANKAFESLLSDLLGELQKEERSTALTQDGALLRMRKLIESAPPKVAEKIHDHFLESTITELWPETSRNDLGGKTPREAAGDPLLKRRLEALLLNLQLLTERPDLVAKLRESLGIEAEKKIAVTDIVAARDVPAVRLPIVDLQSANDEVLTALWNRAVSHAYDRAVQGLGQEIINRRPLLAEELNELDVIGQMVRTSPTPVEAMGWIEKGIALAKAKGQPHGLWRVQELQVVLAQGDAQRFGDLLGEIQRDHAGEPGVSEALFQLLHSLGLIRADGSPASQPPASGEPMQPAQSAASVWSGDESAPAAPAPATEKPASKLWLPGQE